MSRLLTLESTRKKILSRNAVNLYLWGALMSIPLIFSLTAHEEHFHSFRSLFIFALFYALIVYLNNKILIPKFFLKRHYLVYFTILVSLIVVWALFQAQFDFLFYGCNCLIPVSSDRVVTAGFQVSFFVLAFSAFKLIRDYQEKEKAYEDRELTRVENELSFLRDQINPHFLFNTLNTLYAFAIEKSDRVPDFILKLSELMRYMLYDCNTKYVSLSKEIKYLENYITLQQIRMEDRAKVDFKVNGETAFHQIAPSILITFLENCFTHGFDSQSDNIQILIEIEIENDVLKFRSRNNRTSSSEEDDQSSGIGLQNVRKRLNILYANNYNLTIDTTTEYYYVNLEINLT